jgi:hypothetical protein
MTPTMAAFLIPPRQQIELLLLLLPGQRMRLILGCFLELDDRAILQS